MYLVRTKKGFFQTRGPVLRQEDHIPDNAEVREYRAAMVASMKEWREQQVRAAAHRARLDKFGDRPLPPGVSHPVRKGDL